MHRRASTDAPACEPDAPACEPDAPAREPDAPAREPGGRTLPNSDTRDAPVAKCSPPRHAGRHAEPLLGSVRGGGRGVGQVTDGAVQ